MNTRDRSSPKGTLEAVGLAIAAAVFALSRIALTLPHPQFGDEWRYLFYAENLLHGYFSPRPRIFLLNGPVYPLTLAPFLAADWLDGARFLNALWYGAAIGYAWLVVRGRVRRSVAIVSVAALAVYPPLHEHLPLLYTEPLSFFLATAWVFHSLKSAPKTGDASAWHRTAAAIYLALLVLTRVAFGPVLTICLVGSVALWLRRRSWMSRSYALQFAVAFALCVPYLAYTYELTGRVMYWSSAGANNFYWLTSPYADEWGDWYHQGWVYGDPVLKEHHGAIFDAATGLAAHPGLSEQEQLLNLSTPESSDLFFERGVRNIREHPLKFIRNWGGNVVRLFLDVPVSVRGTPFWNVYTVSHLPMLMWTAVVAVYAWRRRVPLPGTWRPVAAFALLSLAGYSVVSSMARFLIPLVPLWWLATCCWLDEALQRARA
jgi:hypothetical protein